MNNKWMADTDLLQYRFRSGRQKKRMQYKGIERKLYALHKEQNILYQQRRHLGWVDLVPPVTKGWKRYFIVREDVARSRDAVFFENILQKINTVTYSSRKDFKKKKKKQGKRIYIVRPQELLHPEWHQFNALHFTDKEKSYFEERLVSKKWRTGPVKVFVFTQPWRFELRVRPNIITKVRAKDEAIEKRLAEIDNYLRRNNLEGRLYRLVNGYYQYHYMREEEYKYRHPFRNKSFQQILDEIKDDRVDAADWKPVKNNSYGE